ncbi:MAG: TIGR00730 family Rossman fold protein [Caulobacteraceae bacterium]
MSASAHRPFSVCVYCASSAAAPAELIDAAARFGAILAQAGVRLVYGGGGLGLMGACARAAHEAGGRVLGVIPGFLTEREAAYTRVETVVVTNMHERKMRMFEEADAFAVLPGAIGTLEEAIELLSWRRLGLHDKPIVFFNPMGFWDPLFALFDQLQGLRLLPTEFAGCWRQVDDIDELLPALIAEPDGEPVAVPIVQRA